MIHLSILIITTVFLAVVLQGSEAAFGVVPRTTRLTDLHPSSSSSSSSKLSVSLSSSSETSSPATLRSMTFRDLVKSQEPQLLCDFLMEIGACSTSITDSDRNTEAEVPIFREPGDNPWEKEDSSSNDAAVVCGDHAVGKNIWKRCDVSAHFPASCDLALVAELVAETLDIKLDYGNVTQVPDRDWVIHVQQSWHPILVEGILLRFPWHTEEDVRKIVGDDVSRVVQLELEGGVAFGTGEHPTTQLCLGWVEETLTENDVSLLMDYGAGSGVLGLAACALNDGLEAVGVDIDLDAVRIANVNSQTNQLPMKNYLPPLETTESDDECKSVLMKALSKGQEKELPLELNGPIYDAVVANILAAPLATLAPTLAGFVKPGGHLGLSGILAPQAEMVMKAYQNYFTDVRVAKELGGWVLISMKRDA